MLLGLLPIFIIGINIRIFEWGIKKMILLGALL